MSPWRGRLGEEVAPRTSQKHRLGLPLGGDTIEGFTPKPNSPIGLRKDFLIFIAKIDVLDLYGTLATKKYVWEASYGAPCLVFLCLVYLLAPWPAAAVVLWPAATTCPAATPE